MATASYDPGVVRERGVFQARRRPLRHPASRLGRGRVLLEAVDSRLRLTARLTACLDDSREPGEVVHETIDLIRQRVFGLCCGYAAPTRR